MVIYSGDEMFLSYLYVSIVILFFSVEEFKKYYKMPGWGKPLYEMKEAEIPKVEIPPAFDWRDKGKSTCTLRSTCCICFDNLWPQ